MFNVIKAGLIALLSLVAIFQGPYAYSPQTMLVRGALLAGSMVLVMGIIGEDKKMKDGDITMGLVFAQIVFTVLTQWRVETWF